MTTFLRLLSANLSMHARRVTRPLSLLALGLSMMACGGEADDVEQPDDPDFGSSATGEEDPEVPPANWSDVSSTVAPTKLWVYASAANSGSGTSNSLKLQYGNASGQYECTLSSGVPRGTWKSCTPTATSTTANQWDGIDTFYMGFATSDDSDGIEVSSIKVESDGINYEIAYFDTRMWSSLDCSGNYGDYYGKCWMDGAGHGNCTRLKMKMHGDTSPTICDD